LGVTVGNHGRRRGRILLGENDPSLVRYAGLAVTGELARRLRLVELIDAELSVERRAQPVKVRRRGASPGQQVVAIAESQLVGGEFFSDLEEVRADRRCGQWRRRRRRRPCGSARRTFVVCTVSGSSVPVRGWESIWIARSDATRASR
jgi:hypothetical protein